MSQHENTSDDHTQWERRISEGSTGEHHPCYPPGTPIPHSPPEVKPVDDRSREGEGSDASDS